MATTRDREPVYWAADLILAVLTLAVLAVALFVGRVYVTFGAWGGTEAFPDSVPTGALVFVGVLSSVAAAASFGFFRLRAGIAGTLHGGACILLIGLLVVLAGGPGEPVPVPTRQAPNCHSGGGHTDCLGG
ncbi:DUF6234 family protein [Streptomyces sp. NBC_00047]|uniref:DUF6234 family protein n=1 Tax=Streptomyces sp. NBC_00047 TaxID=2975627 RepID=UPI00225983E4|nr:DUF6234 family protein [Streptomyces sp. NBC_00047]MCX5606212.1 DUF6234 family protein [Streptomyces sp. NBC_00047]